MSDEKVVKGGTESTEENTKPQEPKAVELTPKEFLEEAFRRGFDAGYEKGREDAIAVCHGTLEPKMDDVVETKDSMLFSISGFGIRDPLWKMSFGIGEHIVSAFCRGAKRFKVLIDPVTEEIKVWSDHKPPLRSYLVKGTGGKPRMISELEHGYDKKRTILMVMMDLRKAMEMEKKSAS